jgi:hypothetical protein
MVVGRAAQEVEWFDTLEEAKAVETASIREELPIHNRAESLISGGLIDRFPVVNLMEAKERLHLLVAQVADSGEPIILARPGSLLAVLVSYRRLKAEAYQ